MPLREIAIGADHRGVTLKQQIVEQLRGAEITVDDCGTNSSESCDYPDVAHQVADRVSDGSADRGILICGSGIGMSMAANKHPAIRAALCHDRQAAEMSRRHNDANVLCLAADRLDHLPDGDVHDLVDVWLKTEFEGGRHQRRVDKIPLTAAVPSQRQ